MESHPVSSNSPLSAQQPFARKNVRRPDFTSLVRVPSAEEDAEDSRWFNWRTFFIYCGPGLLMSVGYLDPGNLESDLQQGAHTGFSLIWLLLLAHITGFSLQTLSVRLGNATGKHLAQLCAEKLPFGHSIIVYLMIEGAIIAADVQGILGSSIAFNILLGTPLWLGCLLTGVCTCCLLAVEVWGVRKLEVLFVALLSFMGTCFFYDYFADAPSMGTVSAGLVPYVHHYATIPAISTLGAVVMPHNIFLHSALVLSRDVDRSRPRSIAEANKYCTIDAGLALLMCFLLNLAVVGSFAQNFFDPNCAAMGKACVMTNIVPDYSPSDPQGWTACNIGGAEGLAGHRICASIGLRSAADALRTSLGRSTNMIWALGLLAAGQCCAVTGTYAGQFVVEGFWSVKLSTWARAITTRGLALGPALAVCILTERNLLDNIDQWINVLQSIMLPFALLPILIFTDSQSIMGEFKNPRIVSGVCWVQACICVAANIYLAGSFFFRPGGTEERNIALDVFVGILCICYFGLLQQVVTGMLRNVHVEAVGCKRAAAMSPLLPEALQDGTNYSACAKKEVPNDIQNA